MFWFIGQSNQSLKVFHPESLVFFPTPCFSRVTFLRALQSMLLPFSSADNVKEVLEITQDILSPSPVTVLALSWDVIEITPDLLTQSARHPFIVLVIDLLIYLLSGLWTAPTELTHDELPPAKKKPPLLPRPPYW